MEKLWNDVEMLITEKLTTEAIFYYAAFIHLVFVNIHPLMMEMAELPGCLKNGF